jgi:hypothetical protein
MSQVTQVTSPLPSGSLSTVWDLSDSSSVDGGTRAKQTPDLPVFAGLDRAPTPSGAGPGATRKLRPVASAQTIAALASNPHAHAGAEPGVSVAVADSGQLIERLQETLKHYQSRLPRERYLELWKHVDALRTRGADIDTVRTAMPQMHEDVLKAVEHSGMRTARPDEMPPRVPTEVSMHWIAALRQAIESLSLTDAQHGAIHTLLDEASCRWMQHDLKVGDVRSTLRSAIKALEQTGGEPAAALGTLAERLDTELAAYGDKEPPTTRLFDNVYGRTFETALIDYLVEHPPADVKRAMSQLGEALAETVEQLEPEFWFGEGLEHVQRLILKKPRFWTRQLSDQNPAFNEFLRLRLRLPSGFLDKTLKEPGSQLLCQMLRAPVQNGVDCIARPYLAVELIAGFAKEQLKVPGKRAADRNYESVITPAAARAQSNSNMSAIKKWAPKTDAAGLTLAHQPEAARMRGAAYATTRPALVNEPTYPESERSNELSGAGGSAKISAETTLALQHGIPYVSGVSGSTNLILHYIQAVNRESLKIDLDHALLGTMMFLTYDGGHALHETLWTMNQTEQSLTHGAIADHQPVEPDASKFKSDYQKYFSGFAGNPETRAALEEATRHAFDTTVEMRRRYVEADALK